MPTTRVLAATDLSESADEALRQADAWAKRHQAALDVCHVMPVVIPIEPMFPHLNPEFAMNSVPLRARLVETLQDRVRSVTGRPESEYTLLVDEGSAAARLVQIADDRNVDLIVVGATGREPLERVLLGSHAEQIVRHAHRTVLVARRGRAADVVLAASDFSDTADATVVAAADEAARRSARLVVVHCLDVGHPGMAAVDASAVLPAGSLDALRAAARETLRVTLERLDVRAEILVKEGPPVKTIAAAARDLGALLLVVGTHGRTGFRRLAMGSVSQGLVRSASCSVLVVRQGG